MAGFVGTLIGWRCSHNWFLGGNLARPCAKRKAFQGEALRGTGGYWARLKRRPKSKTSPRGKGLQLADFPKKFFWGYPTKKRGCGGGGGLKNFLGGGGGWKSGIWKNFSVCVCSIIREVGEAGGTSLNAYFDFCFYPVFSGACDPSHNA